MTFSVLIPAKGDCEFLFETLKSIEFSDTKPFIVSIIDDGMSTHILEMIINTKFNYDLEIIQNSGAGLVDALNTGILNAKTEFIARLDSDDTVLPTRFASQINYLLSNNQVAVVGSQVVYIDKFGVVIGNSNYPVGRVDLIIKDRSQCLIAHPSVMYRRSYVNNVGGYRSVAKIENLDLAEDFDLWLRISLYGEIHILPNNLTNYRQHHNQISTKNLQAQILATYYIAIINSLVENKSYPSLQLTNQNNIVALDEILKLIFPNISFRNKVAFLLAVFTFKKSNNMSNFLKTISYISRKLFKLKVTQFDPLDH